MFMNICQFLTQYMNLFCVVCWVTWKVRDKERKKTVKTQHDSTRQRKKTKWKPSTRNKRKFVGTCHSQHLNAFAAIFWCSSLENIQCQMEYIHSIPFSGNQFSLPHSSRIGSDPYIHIMAFHLMWIGSLCSIRLTYFRFLMRAFLYFCS